MDSKYLVLEGEISPETIAMFNPRATLGDLPFIPEKHHKFEVKLHDDFWQIMGLKDFKVKVLIDVEHLDEKVRSDLKQKIMLLADPKNPYPRSKYSIEEVRQFVESKGGKLHTTAYQRVFAPLEVECKQGHIWNSSFAQLKYNGTWCPICHKVVLQKKREEKLRKSKGENYGIET